MSALVILECNACGVITPPWPTADRAREEAGPDGWAVDVDGSNVDYCPQCTGPAVDLARVIDGARSPQEVEELGHQPPVSRLDVARLGVLQLRDTLQALARVGPQITREAMQSVAGLAARRADELVRELAA
jgi:hypothetical protein